MIKLSGKYINLIFSDSHVMYDGTLLVPRNRFDSCFNYNSKLDVQFKKHQDISYIVQNSKFLANQDLRDWANQMNGTIIKLVKGEFKRRKPLTFKQTDDIIKVKKDHAVVYSCVNFNGQLESVQLGINVQYNQILQSNKINTLNCFFDKPELPLFDGSFQFFVSSITL